MKQTSQQTEVVSAEAERRAAVLLPLLSEDDVPRVSAQAAATQLGISERSVYMLLQRLREANGDPGSLTPGKSAGGRGKSRLRPDTETLLQRLIKGAVVGAPADSPGPSVPELTAAVMERWEADVPLPSPATIQRRIAVHVAWTKGTRVVAEAAAADLSSSAEHLSGTPPDNSLSTGRPAVPSLSIKSSENYDDALLGKLYDAVGDRDGWARFADVLARSYAGGLAAIYVHDAGARQGVAEGGSQWNPTAVAAYNKHFSTVNPWLRDISKRPVALAVPAEFMFPRAELMKTEFFADWLRPQGLLSGVAVTIQQDGSRFMAATVLFPGSTAERDDAAVRRLQHLAPHMKRVAQLKRQLTVLEDRSVSMEAMLDQLAVGIFILNANMEVTFHNKAAASLLAAKDGLGIAASRLRAAFHADHQSLETLSHMALQAGWMVDVRPGGAMRIRRPSGRLDYEVLVAPLSSAAVGPDFAAKRVVVFARDPETQVNAPLRWLRQLYGLTQAEAELVRGLMAGDSLADLGTRLAKRPETLRSQLKSVFRKTGADSQAALIRQTVVGLASVQRG